MYRQFLFLLFVLALGLLLACSSKMPHGNDLEVFAQRKADSIQNSAKIPGILIGILHNGKRSFITAGYADPGKKMPFDSATIFEIGSITKTFTAYILEQVLHEKGISDSSSILPYLPDSVQKNRALASITFSNLMNHTSGLPRLPGNMDQLVISMTPYDEYGEVQLYNFLKTVIPDSAHEFSYSNLGAGLAGVLAERISGRKYSQLLQEHLFDPFAMKRTALTVIGSSNVGQGYAAHDKSPYWNMDILAPAGGIKSNANDLLNYLAEMSDRAQRDNDVVTTKLLNPTVNAFTNMQVGLGWFILKETDQPHIYWHDGGTYGFSTFVAFARNGPNAVIVVINRFDKNNICDELGLQLIKKLTYK